MPPTAADLTRQLLDLARKAGADMADAIAVDGTALSINVRGGQLEHAERAEGVDVGLRVILGKRQACVSATDARPEMLAQMAERAVAMAKEAPEDPYIGLAEPSQFATDTDSSALESCDPGPEPDPAHLQQMAAEAEAAALSHAGITKVDTATASYSRRQIALATSNGFAGTYAKSSHALVCVPIAGEGTAMERDYDHDARVFAADLRDPVEIGTRAAERALAQIGARKPRTGAFPVLFDERIASSLIGHLLSAANGAQIARGSSWLRNSLGEQVLPKGMTLTEDPHRPRISGSKLFDAEGLPTARRDIVADGVLTGWTLDLATGRKLGMPSTANASRGTSAPPSPSLTNLSLTQGTASREDLMAQMGTGLLVTSMIGATINPNTGDYSRGASGFWIENGEIAYPVNECTIAGNLREMLRGLVPANDARRYLGTVVPSLLVEGLTLAGE